LPGGAPAKALEDGRTGDAPAKAKFFTLEGEVRDESAPEEVRASVTESRSQQGPHKHQRIFRKHRQQ
jgi:hypothetical protein